MYNDGADTSEGVRISLVKFCKLQYMPILHGAKSAIDK